MDMPRKIDMQGVAGLAPPLPQADAAFFLDIDGTLLEIADTPSAVRVDRQLLALVQSIHEAAGGAVALISGRRVADIDGLFPGLRLQYERQYGNRYSAAARNAQHLEQIFREACERHGIATHMPFYEPAPPLQPALF